MSHDLRPISIRVVASGVMSLFVLLTSASCVHESVKLFNGEDLSGWEHFLVDEKATMEDVWSVKEGILICKGTPGGYLCTEKDYESFKLIVEWRWPP